MANTFEPGTCSMCAKWQGARLCGAIDNMGMCIDPTQTEKATEEAGEYAWHFTPYSYSCEKFEEYEPWGDHSVRIGMLAAGAEAVALGFFERAENDEDFEGIEEVLNAILEYNVGEGRARTDGVRYPILPEVD